MKATLFAVLTTAVSITQSPGAKAMFHEPQGTRFVGIHYWFENARGEKFAEASAVGPAGTPVTLKVRGNLGAFLTVWMSNAERESIELTPRTDGGPEGRWSGYRLPGGDVFAVPRQFVLAGTDETPERVIIFLARSQTEQVISMSGAREKLKAIASRPVNDGGGPVLVREVDRATRDQIGTYVVHRTGGQTGDEIVMAAAPRK